MPLVFNNTIIKELNGPYSMTCLQPIDPTQLQYYIILFGDVHNEENMRDCHDTKCYELQYEFIEKLNIFAEQVKVEFYVEEFFNRHNDIFDFGGIIVSNNSLLISIEYNNKCIIISINNIYYNVATFVC